VPPINFGYFLNKHVAKRNDHHSVSEFESLFNLVGFSEDHFWFDPCCTATKGSSSQWNLVVFELKEVLGIEPTVNHAFLENFLILFNEGSAIHKDQGLNDGILLRFRFA